MKNILEIDHDEFNRQISHAMLHMARYKADIITRSELITELNNFNDVVWFINNNLTKTKL